VKPTLRADQQKGVEFLQGVFEKHKGALCADIMGLGKTAQAIRLIKMRASFDMPVCIAAPAYLVYNWLDELELWGCKSEVCVIDSKKQVLHDADIYIGSYNMLASDDIHKQLLKKTFSLLCCDEAHTFRTWNSIRSRRLLGTFQNKKSNLLYRSKNALLLTGTPIVNSVEDIYNIVVRIAPQVLKKYDRMAFLAAFAGFLQYSPYGVKPVGVKNEKQLHKLLSSVMLRRSEIPGIKEVIPARIPLQLKGSKLKKFMKEENDFLQRYSIEVEDILKGQDSNTPAACEFAALRTQTALHKIPLLLPAIIDAYECGLRPVVYCWHKAVQEALFTELDRRCKGANIAIVNGAQRPKCRASIVKKYQAGEIDILLPTIGALKEGVNLTEGRLVIFVELPYTPAEVDQVIARFNRTGQKGLVVAKMFYFKDGIDAYIMRLLDRKRDVIQKSLRDTRFKGEA